jgi:hypothetical protein
LATNLPSFFTCLHVHNFHIALVQWRQLQVLVLWVQLLAVDAMDVRLHGGAMSGAEPALEANGVMNMCVPRTDVIFQTGEVLSAVVAVLTGQVDRNVVVHCLPVAVHPVAVDGRVVAQGALLHLIVCQT